MWTKSLFYLISYFPRSFITMLFRWPLPCGISSLSTLKFMNSLQSWLTLVWQSGHLEPGHLTIIKNYKEYNFPAHIQNSNYSQIFPGKNTLFVENMTTFSRPKFITFLETFLADRTKCHGREKCDLHGRSKTEKLSTNHCQTIDYCSERPTNTYVAVCFTRGKTAKKNPISLWFVYFSEIYRKCMHQNQ
jgi:hypothetical protein